MVNKKDVGHFLSARREEDLKYYATKTVADQIFFFVSAKSESVKLNLIGSTINLLYVVLFTETDASIGLGSRYPEECRIDF